MNDRHPMIYNEFDIEAARKAGHSSGAAKTTASIKALIAAAYEASLSDSESPDSAGLHYAMRLIEKTVHPAAGQQLR